jgi:hypothetical protein
MSSTTAASMVTSATLAAVTAAVSGSPLPSQTRWSLLPGLHDRPDLRPPGPPTPGPHIHGVHTRPRPVQLALLRLAHRRHHDRTQDQDPSSEHPQDPGQDGAVSFGRPDQPAPITTAARARTASNSQDGEAPRALVRLLLAGERQDRQVSWQDVATLTGLSRSRAYALLREERTRLAAGNGHQPSRDDPTSGPRHPATAGRAPDA